MEPIQAQMVFCCAEQWMGGYFHRVEPWGDGLRLDPGRASTGVYCLWGAAARFKPVEVITEGEDYYVVQAADSTSSALRGSHGKSLTDKQQETPPSDRCRD